MADQISDQTKRHVAQVGDLAELIDERNKTYFQFLQPGGELHTHRGVLKHDDLIALPYGSLVHSHSGDPFYLLKPTLADLLLKIRRNSQIMYPKDIGFILVTMGIGPGQRVLEAGTGSGALTTALAFSVGPQGQVISYDYRESMQNLAKKNLRSFGLDERVEFKLRDIAEGFDERDVDALYLDVPNPEDYIPQVRQALRPGGPFGCLVPTTNQVSRLIATLEANHFAFIEVCELLLRYYKPVSERLRPSDRMVAHTGFLIFARPMVVPAGAFPRFFPAGNTEEEIEERASAPEEELDDRA